MVASSKRFTNPATYAFSLAAYATGEKVDQVWKLTQRRASVCFSVESGELRRLTLSFTTPPTLKPGTRTLVEIFQRNDKQIIAGSVILELQVRGSVTRAQTKTIC